MSSDDYLPISELKRNPTALVSRVCESRAPAYVTQNGRVTAVVQDIASFEAMQASLAMLRLVALAERGLEMGETVSHDEALGRLRARVSGQRGLFAETKPKPR